MDSFHVFQLYFFTIMPIQIQCNYAIPFRNTGFVKKTKKLNRGNVLYTYAVLT